MASWCAPTGPIVSHHNATHMLFANNSAVTYIVRGSSGSPGIPHGYAAGAEASACGATSAYAAEGYLATSYRGQVNNRTARQGSDRLLGQERPRRRICPTGCTADREAFPSILRMFFLVFYQPLTLRQVPYCVVWRRRFVTSDIFAHSAPLAGRCMRIGLCVDWTLCSVRDRFGGVAPIRPQAPPFFRTYVPFVNSVPDSATTGAAFPPSSL